MKAREREIVINDTWASVISMLPDKKAGKLFKKIIHYSLSGEFHASDDKTVNAIFSEIRTDMDIACLKE